MNPGAAVLRLVLLAALTIPGLAILQIASADCFIPRNGQIVMISVESCEVIDGRTNPEVLKYAGKNPSIELKKLYTGALVTEAHGIKSIYPSDHKDPCRKFVRGSQVRMRTYLTCCDSGRWGKCVFGGRWLGDVDGKPIDTDQ